MATSRKFGKGDAVRYRGQRWVVCEGGYTSPTKKSYIYKIARGAWKRNIAGNCLTSFNG